MLKIAARGIISKFVKNKFNYSEITEQDLSPILREIRIALLNSDVNLGVVKSFLEEVKKDLINRSLAKHEELDIVVFSTLKSKLINILGSENKPLNVQNKFSKILVVGLNGSGKTTTVGKLSYYLKKKGSKVKNFSLDIYRPGAFEQLKTLSDSVDIPSFHIKDFKNEIKECIKDNELDVLLFDSFGLLPDNNKLIEEITQIKKYINPSEVLFVADAVSGQELLNTVKVFHEHLDLTGLIVSKADSGSSMGAAFSIAYLLNLPIKFLGDGEKISNLSPFHPGRIANLILGEGDILSLAEKIESEANLDISQKLVTRMFSGKFDLDDLVKQIKDMKKMGSLRNIVKFLPGNFDKKLPMIEAAESQLHIWEILINSMTLKERRNPRLFKKQPNRKVRVIKGSGRKPDELNKLLKKWEESRKKIEELSSSFKKGKNPFASFFK
ncbi:signal recognition particle [Candidatus Mycoplasma haematobovis]|uniref:signal-recognition-particle GTPase n=1 Tax=Candidatus Mycoplasma haematobovis TaxID=432608 RepID=A0A1A9QDG5_9MOLU|nr:signal recognition particle receptor subunit alpha [Candidatus Mycoplasma haematobovis]OAL10288.1 signal recognition particle [Candidatus Mycoplasma haematobovis]